MHETGFLSYLSSRIHYHTWGAGPAIVFAFHGYGESGDSFAFLGTSIGPGRTLVAIDFPFHGLTEWKEAFDLQPAQLLEIMKVIATRFGAAAVAAPAAASSAKAALPSAPWRLLGYSMGGRVALRLLQDCPAGFDRLILAAPDGMTVNPWYWIATATAAGRLLFRWSMRRPAWLFLLLRLCHALRVVNPSVYKFAVHYIDDREARNNLHIRWIAMRHFQPKSPRIARIIRDRRLPVTLVYGKFDRIILPERGEAFRRHAGDSCHLVLVEAGHQLLRPQFLPVFLPLVCATPLP